MSMPTGSTGDTSSSSAVATGTDTARAELARARVAQIPARHSEAAPVRPARTQLGLLYILASLLVLGVGTLRCTASTAEDRGPESSASQSTRKAEPRRYPVTIRLPTSLGVVDTDLVDPLGRPIGIACATCHAPGASASMSSRAELDTFHLGVEIRHGDLTCASCHSDGDQTRLRLADGQELAFSQVQQLCRQCHGPQYRDYEAGAHGGMRGYWDLSRGPRERNACIMCHAPHAPAYPQVIPAAPPRDRFLAPSRSSQTAPAEHSNARSTEAEHG